MHLQIRILSLVAGLASLATALPAAEMNEVWGEQVVMLRAEDATRGQLFAEGSYAMFIHWGLYSMLGRQYDGKTYYGSSEWIMNFSRPPATSLFAELDTHNSHPPSWLNKGGIVSGTDPSIAHAV